MADFGLNSLPQYRIAFKAGNNVQNHSLPQAEKEQPVKKDEFSNKDYCVGLATALSAFLLVRYRKNIGKSFNTLTQRLKTYESNSSSFTKMLKEAINVKPQNHYNNAYVTNNISNPVGKVAKKKRGFFGRLLRYVRESVKLPKRNVNKNIISENVEVKQKRWSIKDFINSFKKTNTNEKLADNTAKKSKIWSIFKFKKNFNKAENIGKSSKTETLFSKWKRKLFARKGLGQKSNLQNLGSNLSSQIKCFFSNSKKYLSNKSQFICESFVSSKLNPKNGQSLFKSFSNVAENTKKTWAKAKTVFDDKKTKLKEIAPKLAKYNPLKKKNSVEKTNLEKNGYIQNRSKTKAKATIFKKTHVKINKVSKNLDNLYTTMTKAPENMSKNDLEYKMTSLCDSIGHSFDNLKSNSNYVDSLIKKYGNMKHLTATLSKEEIAMASKLEQVFKRFKSIQFPS